MKLQMGGFKKKFRYCVIKLKKTRESGLDPYVCVPYSWLKLHKRALVVKYPKEITSMTSYMVKHCEVSQPDWLTIGAEIKYKTGEFLLLYHYHFRLPFLPYFSFLSISHPTSFLIKIPIIIMIDRALTFRGLNLSYA